MCGRYVFTSPFEAVVRLFGVDEVHGDPGPPRYNVAPSQEVPVVRLSPYTPKGEPPARELTLLRWGLVPFWSKDETGGHRMINARAETVAEKPAFRQAFRKRRCLVIADGFYEWKKAAAAKEPWFVRARDGEPLAFAGLWEHWDGKRSEAPLESCALITSRANAFMRPLHDRMPAILAAPARDAWLDPECPPSRLLGLLEPAADGHLEGWPVSRRVNSPFNDGPELLEPAASGSDPDI